jgi:hypothetical protein
VLLRSRDLLLSLYGRSSACRFVIIPASISPLGGFIRERRRNKCWCTTVAMNDWDMALDGRGRHVFKCEWRRKEILPCRTCESADQAGRRSTSGRKRVSARVQTREFGRAMGRLHETGAGRPSVRGAAYNESGAARSGFTRGRTSYNSQRGSPHESCTRGHSRHTSQRDACRVCVFHQSYPGTNHGQGVVYRLKCM